MNRRQPSRLNYGHFKYQLIPFGLFNIAASFQDYINKILAEKFDIFVIIYIDYIFIYIENPGQVHINAIWWVPKELRKHGFFAKFKKWQFHKDKIRFIGYDLSAQGVWIEDERIEAGKNWPKPKSVHNI